MRIRVKVLKDHPYSKGLKVGDTYEVSGQSQLGLVKAMGWAEEATEPAAAPIQTRAMVSPAVKSAVRAKRGSYLTRDMTAEQPASPPAGPSPLRSFATATPPVDPPTSADE